MSAADQWPLEGPAPGVSPSTELSPRERTLLGFGAACAALLVGIACDSLLRIWPWGLNVALNTLVAVGVTAVLIRWRNLSLQDGRWLVLPALLFAAAVAWRDSPTLKVVNTLAVLLSVLLSGFSLRGARLRSSDPIDVALGCLAAAAFAALGALALLFDDIQWSRTRPGALAGPLLGVLRGLLIALPLLAVFGLLFASADAAFERLARALFDFDLQTLLNHLAVVGLFAWLSAGWLDLALIRGQWRPVTFGRPLGGGLGAIEIGTVLGLVDLLFLSFVIVQAGYLFGGSVTVLAEGGPTYAEYARRGFFELVTVAALALGLLLAGDALLRYDRVRDVRLFRLLAGVLVGLLTIVLVSAQSRMLLYVQIFGLTELRLYTSAFMFWIGLALAWFVATVLRSRRQAFVSGALLAGFLVLGALNWLNPDDLIVRSNAGRTLLADSPPLARSNAGPRAPLDDRYLTALSGDAVPALIDSLPVLTPDQRPQVVSVLLRRWPDLAEPDWRTWSWSRQQARLAVQSSRPLLESIAGPTR